VWDQWLDHAFLARYGHQQIDTLLGRRPTRDDLRLLARAVMYWLELEKEDPNV